MNNRAVLAEMRRNRTSAAGHARACGHVERLRDAIEVRLARRSSPSVSRLMVASCASSIEAYGRWIRMAGSHLAREDRRTSSSTGARRRAPA
jgi:hypothetical protein